MKVTIKSTETGLAILLDHENAQDVGIIQECLDEYGEIIDGDVTWYKETDTQPFNLILRIKPKEEFSNESTRGGKWSKK